MILEIVLVVCYLFAIGYLGFLGYRHTKTASDYLLAGRQTHPFVMAMSYGATFISTSAIVGFGGVAGLFGLSLMWLTFLNIFVGIFLAFVALGGPTRHMGHRLDAHTFPELLGRRYQSRFVQILAGAIIFLFIPLYAAAVLMGGCEFLSLKFGISYDVALLVFSVMIASYVIVGGLKAVMYTDALQGTIMFFSILILLFWTYGKLGGVTAAHEQLSGMADQAFVGQKMIGLKGWTVMPEFGWGEAKYDLWWIIVSTILMGVGIGVLAQPQLAVRFMTVKSKKELNRAVLIGGVFILVMIGVVYAVGSLSNLYFYKYEKIQGRILSTTENTNVIAKKEPGIEKTVPCRLLHIDSDGDGSADTTIVANGVGKAEAIMPKAEVKELGEGMVEIYPRATAFTRAVVSKGITPAGQEVWAFNPGSIIPLYITSAMPDWFGLLFLLTLLAASMSTLSSQFHACGTSIGRDVYEQMTGRHGKSIQVTRIGVVIGLVIAVLFSHYARGGYIIARVTAIFFGLCASSFLPAFVGGLFFKRMTRAGAIWSMIIGFLVTAFWLLFIKDAEARSLGLCKAMFDKYSLLLDHPSWPMVDPIVVALPISIVVMTVVSLLTKKPDQKHLDVCFGKPR